MKRKILAAALGLCLTLPFTAQSADKAKDKLETFEDKLSYSVGTAMGASLAQIKDEVALEVVLQGIRDKFDGKELLITQEEAQQVQQQFMVKMQEKEVKRQEELTAKGLALLEENKKKKGVTVTESGLQYEVIKKGNGPKPTAEDTVTVDYVGMFADGTTFDSSVERGEPASFAAGQVIPGWTETLLLMPVGSKFKIVIPPSIGYGEQGAPPVIPPNAVLVFEVELHSIQEKKEEVPAEESKKE